MSFLQGIAGPSRCRLTTLTLTSTRNLTTSSFVRFARPTFILLSPHPSKRPNRPIVAAPHNETPSVQSQIGRHGSTGVKSSWIRPKETLSYEKGYPDWEWVKEPVQPTDEYVEERRTIYARPPFQFYGRPHFIKYMWAIASLMVVMTILMPDTSDVAKVPDQLHIPPDVASDPKAVAQIVAGHEDSIRRRQFFNSILDSFTVVKFGIIVAIGGIVYIGSRQMTNCVTRLTQIRRVSLKPDVPVQYLIRVRTAIHEANIPMNPTHEDFTLKDTSVYYAGRQTGFLGLVAGGHSKYRMDLSPVDVDARDGEYVLSLNRLERIYGEIKMPTWDLNKRAPWAKLSDKVDAWAERR